MRAPDQMAPWSRRHREHPQLRSSCSSRLDGEAGNSVVEFAIILPVFALMLFALIDFGLAFGGMITLRSDVNAGARLASVSQTDASCAHATNPMLCTIDDRIGSLPGIKSGSVQVGIALPDGSTAGDSVVVCAQATLQSTSGLTSTFIGGRTVNVSSVLRLEQDAAYIAGGLAC